MCAIQSVQCIAKIVFVENIFWIGQKICRVPFTFARQLLVRFGVFKLSIVWTWHLSLFVTIDKVSKLGLPSLLLVPSSIPKVDSYL